MTNKECICWLLSFSKRHVPCWMQCFLCTSSHCKLTNYSASLSPWWWVCGGQNSLRCNIFIASWVCYWLSCKQRPTQPHEWAIPGSPSPLQKPCRAETFAQSPSSGHDSNLWPSKAVNYYSLGSFHLELFKPRELAPWLSESHYDFSQGVFQRMLVPVNVYRCWVFSELSRKFEEPWHFKQVPFPKTSAFFTCQLWVCKGG